MNGGTLMRRGLLAAALIGGSIVSIVVGLAGAAQANDHSTEAVCLDKTSGAWRASISFASIDVHDGHPVVITFGGASTTLTEPGPNGTATLHQDFSSQGRGRAGELVDRSQRRSRAFRLGGLQQARRLRRHPHH